MNHKKLIVVAGPTAVGKTAVAIKIAHHFKSEIISADSRQFFRELTIGTAKPAEHELQQVQHHFINSHSINERYDAAQFGQDALKKIYDLFKIHDHVVLCGGSGLYIKAVTEGFDEIPPVPEVIREELVAMYNEFGIESLQQKMKDTDPDYFPYIDQQNPHRLIRALEVKIGTGISISAFRTNAKLKHDFQIVKIGLELPREVLYRRIDDRMDTMIAQGLFKEAADLYSYKSHNALQTVGYQEIYDMMDGHYDEAEAIRLLKRNSRRYAKRQLTWFKKDPEFKWFDPHQVDTIIEYVKTT